MKRCSYCGKEYLNEEVLCANDGQPLQSSAPLFALPARSVFAIACFAVLSAFTGVGLAWIAIATIANHMNRTPGGGHMSVLAGNPGDDFVARSIPILVVGGALGFIAGLLGKAASENRKLKAQQAHAA